MSKQLLELDNNADYAMLREWCMTCCDFIVRMYPEMTEFVTGVKNIIMRIDSKQNIRQIRSVANEVDWLIQDGYLSDSAMDTLNQTLTEKFKDNLIDASTSKKDEIQKILKRGKILNDREYELVKLQEEKIYDDESQFNYAESLRNLLGDYEMNS